MVARGEPPTFDDDREHVITRGDIHNIRNRVAVIKGYTQLLERQLATSDDDRAKRRVATLAAEVERLEEAVARWSSGELVEKSHRPG